MMPQMASAASHSSTITFFSSLDGLCFSTISNIAVCLLSTMPVFCGALAG
jgi:hypothetical protein